MSIELPKADELSVAATLLLIEQGAVLLDVRSPSEFRAGHAPGSQHVGLPWVALDAPAVIGDRPVVTVCSSGYRSSQAAAVLARAGSRAYSLSGGLHAWQRAGQPLVDARGRRGEII